MVHNIEKLCEDGVCAVGGKRGQQVRYRSNLRQTVNMNMQLLIMKRRDAKDVVLACRNLVFLQLR